MSLQPHQRRLLALLAAHHPADATEREHRDRIAAFVAEEPACFDRRTLPGHITGSAFILDPAAREVLLHHHRKLDRWLQMGGHDEGERDAAATALREAREESGLTELRLDEPAVILDVDVHAIPERPGEPGHLHLDVRFVVWGSVAEQMRLDPAESKALRWWPLDQAAEQMGEAGAVRVMSKLRA